MQPAHRRWAREPETPNAPSSNKEEAMKKSLIAFTVLLVGLTVSTPALRAEESSPGADLMTLYGKVHDALADDSQVGVVGAAVALSKRATALAESAKDRAPYEALAKAASAMQAGDLDGLREQFKELSTAMAAVVKAGGISDAQLYYCPMAKAYWLQKSGDEVAHNPYYGKSMSRCGAKVEKIGS